MIHIDNVILDKICLHKVGNKVEEEGVIFSKSPLCVNENISKLLVNYFFANFRNCLLSTVSFRFSFPLWFYLLFLQK